jgi:predicted metal-dependent enzyme (double-stranded beta helix superfamily)
MPELSALLNQTPAFFSDLPRRHHWLVGLKFNPNPQTQTKLF